jgi:hypothetical protein
MARARRRKPEVQVDAREGKPIVKSLPAMCPLCGVSVPREMLTHLLSHAPGELCQRCDGKEKGWRLDTDGATHFRPDMSLFYCSHCGRYPSMTVGEEASPSGEA